MPHVQDVSMHDLAGVSEIASRSGVSVNTVQAWRRRYESFPPPLITLAAGPIWNWNDVAGWIESRHRYRRRPVEVVGDRSRFGATPGYDLVATGAADLAAGRDTIEAALVRSASQRLAALGFAIPGG